MTAPITIVGSGLAGYNLARELRKHAPDALLRIITADAGEFYSKPMLSNALSANKTAQQLAMKTAEQMAAELKAEVLPATRLLAIQPAGRAIETSAGRFDYAQLVLALGADTFTPPIEGDGVADVISVNDLADYARFRDRLADAQGVVLLGGGLIGCEFANDMVGAGKRVDVIDLATWPLSRLLPQQAGEHLQAALVVAGVEFHLGASVRAVVRDGSGYRVQLADGRQLSTDLVVSAIGLRPRTALAAAAGLAVGRGILVDRHLRTSDPHVYALGDCAEVDGQVLPFVLPIMQCARALGPTLAGKPTAVSYPAMPVVVKTPACPTVVSPPAAGSVGEWRFEAVEAGLKATFVDGAGRLLGFALHGSAVAERQALAPQLPAILA
jgi:rubredoxin-NAD+ reductase